jgi:hypothetical protein
MVGSGNGFSLWLFFFLHSFVQGLSERYPELFEEPGGNITQHQVNFGRKWGSYSTVVQLAGEDILKFDEVTQRPLEECLLYLAYQSDKSLMENLIHKENLNKYKH